MEAVSSLSDRPRFIRLDTADSTNNVLRSMADAPHATVVIAREQTAGRGQRGNSWEAEPGQNVTMSMMIRPRSVSARDQFIISEAVALGVANIMQMLAGDSAEITVKWPNDIYADDLKIAGILIENTLSGSEILSSIAGIGVNINQRLFKSDAPNPVSLYQLTGLTQNVAMVAELIASEIISLVDTYVATGRHDELHAMYLERLWRRSGFHPYVDAATGQSFDAVITDVALTGHLTLRLTDDTLRTYAFKEVTAVI